MERQPINICMEAYRHYMNISGWRTNPMATPTRCRERSWWKCNSWTPCSPSIRMDGWSFLVLIGYTSYPVILYGLFSCFKDETCIRGVECSIPREVIWEVPIVNGVMYY
jgi:hypothetical protein